jgi:hypothetical protein
VLSRGVVDGVIRHLDKFGKQRKVDSDIDLRERRGGYAQQHEQHQESKAHVVFSGSISGGRNQSLSKLTPASILQKLELSPI